jgi:leucyl aminopeptidase
MNIELKTLSSFTDLSEVIIAPITIKETTQLKSPAKKKSDSKKDDLNSKSPFHLLTPETRDFVDEINKESNGEFLKRLKRIEFSPSTSEKTEIPVVLNSKLHTVKLAGLPKEAFSVTDTSIDYWRKLGGDSLRTGKRLKSSTITISLRCVSRELLESVIGAVCEGIRLADYEFTKYKTGTKKKATSGLKITFLLRERATKAQLDAIKNAKIKADSVILARDLVNTPAADMLPKDIVAAAKAIKSQIRRAKIKVFGESDLRRMKANLILCVSAGSLSKPYLIHLTLPAKSKGKIKKVVLVGKGVAYDTGGLCLKPGKSMEDMKCDMSGAAAVLGTFLAFAQLGREDIELHVVIPTTENSVSAPSVRPGDIVTSMNGKTVEVLNTDAEGRLILADAITYASRINGDIMIDLATLTGACVVALGDDYAGLFTNDKQLRDQIIEGGRSAGELIWPLPLAKEYKQYIKGQVGDLRNIGTGNGAGATIGALFIEEFVPSNVRWAHIDIAGPAFMGRGGDYSVAGATGFGVRTLLNFLENV